MFLVYNIEKIAKITKTIVVIVGIYCVVLSF